MVEKTARVARSRGAPNSLISLAPPKKVLPAPAPALSKAHALEAEQALARWDAGETYVWNRAARKARLPSIQAQREQCCSFYLQQLYAAFDGKAIDTEMFLWSLRGVLTAKASRFVDNSVLMRQLQEMQHFLGSDEVGLYPALVSGLWDYWQDEDARKRLSTMHMRAYASRLEMNASQVKEASLLRTKADNIDKQAHAIYAALVALDSASSFFGRIAAWGSLVFRCGFIFPERAREFYKAYHLSNAAEALKVTTVQAMLTKPQGLNVIGDTVVRNFFKQKQQSEDAVVVVDTKQHNRQLRESKESLFATNYKKNESHFVKLSKQCSAMVRVLAESSPLPQPLERIKFLLDLYVSWAKQLDEVASVFDPEGFRKEKRLIPWCAELAPSSIKNKLETLGKLAEQLEVALKEAFAAAAQEIMDDDNTRVAQIHALLSAAKKLLPPSLGSADTVLLSELGALIIAKEDESEKQCIEQLAMMYREAEIFMGSFEFKQLTVSDVLAWRRSLHENMVALVDNAQLGGDAQTEVLLSISERGKVLNEKMSTWYDQHIKDWSIQQKPALDLYLTTLQKMLNDENGFAGMEGLLAESVAFLNTLEGQATTYFDKEGRRGEKRVFEWLGELSGSPLKEVFQHIDKRVQGIERQFVQNFQSLLLPLQAELAKAYQDEVALLDDKFAPWGADVGWQQASVARYHAFGEQQIVPMQEAVARAKAGLKKRSEEKLFKEYAQEVVKAHQEFDNVLRHKAEKSNDTIVQAANEAEEAGWQRLEYFLSENGKADALPIDADKVAESFAWKAVRFGAGFDDARKETLKAKSEWLKKACDWVSEWLAERQNVVILQEGERKKEHMRLWLKYHPDKQAQGDALRLRLAQAVLDDVNRCFAHTAQARAQAAAREIEMSFEDVDTKSLQSCEQYVELLQAKYERQYELLRDKMLLEVREDPSIADLRKEYVRLNTALDHLGGIGEGAIVPWVAKEALLAKNEKQLFASFTHELGKLRHVPLKLEEKEKLQGSLLNAECVIEQAFTRAQMDRRAQKICLKELREIYEERIPSLTEMVHEKEAAIQREKASCLLKAKRIALQNALIAEQQAREEAEARARQKDEALIAKDEALNAKDEALTASEQARLASEARVKELEAMLKLLQATPVIPSQAVNTVLQFQGYQGQGSQLQKTVHTNEQKPEGNGMSNQN